jgi:hypothetical protein
MVRMARHAIGNVDVRRVLGDGCRVASLLEVSQLLDVTGPAATSQGRDRLSNRRILVSDMAVGAERSILPDVRV